jgi:hypothetical protein
MTAFQKFDPHTFLKRERRAPDGAPTFAAFATFAGRPPNNGICGTASEVLSQCDTGAVAAKSIETQRDHPAVEHDLNQLGKKSKLNPLPGESCESCERRQQLSQLSQLSQPSIGF